MAQATQGPGAQAKESDIYQGGNAELQKSFKLRNDIIKTTFWKDHFGGCAGNSLKKIGNKVGKQGGHLQWPDDRC